MRLTTAPLALKVIDMAYFIKDFSKFQHFKDRTPPWVKLYRDILDDPDWHELAPEAAKTLVMLWLIASEDDNKSGMLPDNKKLAFRLRITDKNLRIILSQLSHWLIQDDIKEISKGDQPDAPERAGEETETETEKIDVELEILNYLNSKTGSGYRNVEANRRLIAARLKDGTTVDQVKEVIDAKCSEWLNDEKMSGYLRPITLFAASNFESYLGALNKSSSNDIFAGVV